MKIEIENDGDYIRGRAFLWWLRKQLERAAGMPTGYDAIGNELHQALDDYEQIRWPLGGGPKPEETTS